MITLLPPPGGIAIRRVCWLVRSFVNIRPLTRSRPSTRGHWCHWRAGTGHAQGECAPVTLARTAMPAGLAKDALYEHFIRSYKFNAERTSDGILKID